MLKAFDTGADDYVVKPFSIKVLLKRIEVVLKRKSNENTFICGQVILYSDRKQVSSERRKYFDSQRVSAFRISYYESESGSYKRDDNGKYMGNR